VTEHTPSVLEDPLVNRGAAFTVAEREALGLTGRLPSAVLTLEQQARRVYEQLGWQPGDLAKNASVNRPGRYSSQNKLPPGGAYRFRRSGFPC
jgi:hypothetical protein